MAKKPSKLRGVAELNLTSMLDVIFQLIIFFLLITNFSSAELPELLVPEPVKPRTIPMGDEKKVVINVIPNFDGMTKEERKNPDLNLDAKYVRVGQATIEPQDYKKLTELIEKEVEQNPEIHVNLRADARIKFAQVQPVMQAITAAKIVRVNLVAHLDHGND